MTWSRVAAVHTFTSPLPSFVVLQQFVRTSWLFWSLNVTEVIGLYTLYALFTILMFNLSVKFI
jgi:hypothetical protein